jgi:hypothetical protein
MYESELIWPQMDPTIRDAHRLGFRVVRDVVAAQLPKASSTEVDIQSLTLWSTWYGFASLRNKKLIQGFEPSALEPVQVVKAIVRQAVTGLVADD